MPGESTSRDGAVATRVESVRLAPQTGTGFLLPAGALLTVVDPTGGQVSDFFCFNAADHGESLSSGRTIDVLGRIAVRRGDALYSNRSRPMVTVEADTCGRHDFLLTPCSQQTFDMLYPEFGGAPHPSCLANLAAGLAPFGIDCDDIGTSFNIFMNVWFGRDGAMHIDPPVSRPGDYVSLRAQQDLHVGLTACSAEKSNGGILKPIDFRIQPPPADDAEATHDAAP
jgi:uncharacterized protein YcgI (DUF1989 family)